MAYFYVNVKSTVERIYLIEAANSWTADAEARKAVVAGNRPQNGYKTKETVSTYVEVDRLPDDGDIYNAEIQNALEENLKQRDG